MSVRRGLVAIGAVLVFLCLGVVASAAADTPSEGEKGPKWFQKVDTDGDGVLNGQELVAFLDKDGNGSISVKEARRLVRRRKGKKKRKKRRLGPARWFKRHDANKDGKLDREEFGGPPEAFDAIDTDGDGFISLDEAKKMPRFSKKRRRGRKKSVGPQRERGPWRGRLGPSVGGMGGTTSTQPLIE